MSTCERLGLALGLWERYTIGHLASAAKKKIKRLLREIEKVKASLTNPKLKIFEKQPGILAIEFLGIFEKQNGKFANKV